MATKLKEIPRGYRIIDTPSGTYIQKQKQRRKQYKTPKATRDRIKAGLRRTKFPIITIAINAPPIIGGIRVLAKGFNRPTGMISADMLNEVLGPYSGIRFTFDGTRVKFGDWKPGQAWALWANLANMGLRRLGVYKPVNKQFANMKIPLRLG